MNEFSCWDLCSCVPIILFTLNKTIEGWVWIQQYIPKYVANIILVAFSFINNDRVIWGHITKKVF